jgi:hypothetical protein
MSEVPYAILYGKIPTYLAKIQETGVPQKVDTQWLRQCGFNSGNDNYILQVLKFIGFVDDAKIPTELWRAYKSPTQAPITLAQGIKKGYSDLFNLYPDAYRKDRDTLYAYFSQKTGKAKSTVEYIVNTFTGLCKLADFGVSTEKPIAEPINQDESNNNEKKSVQLSTIPSMIPDGFAINMNIQITLPITEDAKVYENIFKAIREQLFKSN